jgi:hypothetical protein
MSRHRLAIAVLLTVLAAPGFSARAQFFYPGGYGGWGWGGWGGQTVEGANAQGLGIMAAGLGSYNLQSAQAASIDTDTVIRWNTYMWQAQSERNYNYYTRQVKDRQSMNAAADAIYKRLRNNPTATDVEGGNALNVAFDELSNPKVYLQSLSAAGTKLPGDQIRDIPFQKATAGITTSFHDLTHPGGVPEVFRTPAFDDLRAQFITLSEELKKEDEETGAYDPRTLKAIQDLMPAAWKTLDTALPDKNSRERRQAENYLKALNGLFRLMETPDLNIFLAGVDKRPDTTLGDLLRFMISFNLRFGPATNARQLAVYRNLYPLLVKLRDQAVPAAAQITSLTEPAHPSPKPMQEFFEGMDRADLNAKKTPPPPAPAPSTPAPAPNN